jgi:hypothetical protein
VVLVVAGLLLVMEYLPLQPLEHQTQAAVEGAALVIH